MNPPTFHKGGVVSGRPMPVPFIAPTGSTIVAPKYKVRDTPHTIKVVMDYGGKAHVVTKAESKEYQAFYEGDDEIGSFA